MNWKIITIVLSVALVFTLLYLVNQESNLNLPNIKISEKQIDGIFSSLDNTKVAVVCDIKNDKCVSMGRIS